MYLSLIFCHLAFIRRVGEKFGDFVNGMIFIKFRLWFLVFFGVFFKFRAVEGFVYR